MNETCRRGLGAVVLHATLLYTRLWLENGLNLAFTLVACVIAALYLATSLVRPVDNLGILALLLLSCFGSKFVLEVILHR